MDSLRVLLVDDQILFRKGIASLLSASDDFIVVGEAGDGVEAVRVAQQTRPDVILLDINMPRRNGLETVKVLRQEMPDLEIVMLTISDDDDDLFEAIKYGAKGYLLKNLEPQELYRMLDAVRRGEAAISGSLATRILHEFARSGDASPSDDDPDDLTPREIEVLEQVVTGATNKEIAERLVITENTVKIHLRNILEKLHVKNRIQAAVRAVREGIVDDEDQVDNLIR